MIRNLIARFPDGGKIDSIALSNYGEEFKKLIAKKIETADLDGVQKKATSLIEHYAEMLEPDPEKEHVAIAANIQHEVLQKTMSMYEDWIEKKLLVGPAALEYLIEIIRTELDAKTGMLFHPSESEERLLFSNNLLERYQEKWSENDNFCNSYGEHAIRQAEEIVNWIFE